MPKILIDILPALGHFHASLKMASLLKNAGYDVIIGSSPLLQKEIKKNGFQFINLPEVPVTNISLAERASFKNGILVYLYWSLYHEKYSERKKDVEAFQNLVNEVKPDLVLLDEQAALKTFLYEAVNISVATFQTKPDTRKIKSLPPFTSYYLPKFNFASNIYCKLIWQNKLLKYKLNYLNNRILSIGQDNFSLFKKIATFFEVYKKERIDLKRSFCIGVKGIHRFVISPAAFDFPHPGIENVHRIGPLIDIKREGKLTQPRYSTLLKRLESDKENRAEFVVYCSLGTITNRLKNDVKRFFKRIAKVATLNPDMLFILSAGTGFDIEVLFPAPENLLIFDRVPQVDLLQYCDLMITHGGMNSITECIYNNVPLLVYPLSPHWDQPGNSARVVYHGLGLRGKIRKDSVRLISKKINQLKLNYNDYKKNVIVIKSKFDEKNNSEEVLEIVDNILKGLKRI